MYSGFQRIDLHGKNSYQSRIIIDSELRRAAKGVYQIRIVHGQNNGIELKNMVWREYANHPKVKRIEAGSNGGETILILRDLF